MGATIPVADIKLDRIEKGFSLAIVRAVTDHLKLEGELKDVALAGFLRQRASDGSPGALVILTDRSRVTIPLGDEHGNKTMLDYLLNRFRDDLILKRINLVFLGDFKDPENGDLRDMKSSYDLFKALVMLKYHFPDNVHILPGNHDAILPGVKDINVARTVINYILTTKQAEIDQNYLFKVISLGVDRLIGIGKEDKAAKKVVWQGVEFLRHLVLTFAAEGKSVDQIAEELMAYQELLDHCPLAMVAEGDQAMTFLSHFGIVRGGYRGLSSLIDARLDPDLVMQMLWNRFKENDPNNSKNRQDLCSVKDVVMAFANLAGIFKRKLDQVHIIAGHIPGKLWAYSPISGNQRFRVNHANIADNPGAPSYGFTRIVNGLPQEETVMVRTRAA